MEIIKRGEYSIKGKTVSILKELNDSIYGSALYKPEELDELLNQEFQNQIESTVIEVTGETTLEASKRLLDEGYIQVSALNFASAKNPGGGFLTGSRAQEESIARSSGLYPAIAQMKEMYDYNRGRKTGMYSDYMIFSPKVPVFRHDKGYLLEKPYLLSVITSPAVNAGIVREREKEKVKNINEVMLVRIKKILAIAKAQKQEALVLGAFGCGVFGNNPVAVAKLFKEALEDASFKNQFKKIVFAVYEGTPQKPMLSTFKQSLQIRK
ncbi:TIGR02452 family protein [Bacillus sp. M6-12]|uniref:TIGR02452 family protein n=1 Tax=Bacillus sp. M6-12 TaxID=2054166 RepID=UPI00215554C3|nr:TIGR02452 family protein [Bacillus sp. M6-12]